VKANNKTEQELIMKTLVTYFVLSLFLVLQIFPQKYWERRFKDYNNPDELVTMSETLPFTQAVDLISKVSESITGKRVVSTLQSTEPIGVEIVNMPYDKALMIIVQYANLQYEEKQDIIVITSKEVEQQRDATTYASVDSREVKISAVFFEMDVEKSRKIGVDWKFLLSGKNTDIFGLMRTETEGAQQSGGESGGSTQSGEQPEFNLGVSSKFSVGNFFADATATFKFFEDEGIFQLEQEILPAIQLKSFFPRVQSLMLRHTFIMKMDWITFCLMLWLKEVHLHKVKQQLKSGRQMQQHKLLCSMVKKLYLADCS
jgi:type IV pilus assembly protein PilQ